MIRDPRMAPYHQNDVSRAVWPWTDPEPGVQTPSRLVLFVATAVAWGVAALLFFKWQHRVLPALVLVISTLNLVGGLWVPPLHAGIMRGLQALGQVVGWILTGLLLVPFFFLVFTPARLVLRLRGKDPMQRACPTDLPTYWRARETKTDPEGMRRQG